MSMLSTAKTVPQESIRPRRYEIWVIIPDRYAAPLQDCGFFDDRKCAESLAPAVLACLRFEKWDYPLFDPLPPDGQDELRFLHRGLSEFGVDLGAAKVEVREFKPTRHGDNRDSETPKDHMTRLYPWLDPENFDEDEEDTTLEAPAMKSAGDWLDKDRR